MITEYRVLGSLGIGTGLLLFAGATLSDAFHAPLPLIVGLHALCLTVSIFGCANYARGKGFSPLFGLAALIPPLGFVLVSILPDRRKQEPTEVMQQVQEAKQRRATPPKRDG